MAGVEEAGVGAVGEEERSLEAVAGVGEAGAEDCGGVADDGGFHACEVGGVEGDGW